MKNLKIKSSIESLSYPVLEEIQCGDVKVVMIGIPRGVNEYNNIFVLSKDNEII